MRSRRRPQNGERPLRGMIKPIAVSSAAPAATAAESQTVRMSREPLSPYRATSLARSAGGFRERPRISRATAPMPATRTQATCEV